MKEAKTTHRVVAPVEKKNKKADDENCHIQS
jgi:hypothetical protein